MSFILDLDEAGLSVPDGYDRVVGVCDDTGSLTVQVANDGRPGEAVVVDVNNNERQVDLEDGEWIVLDQVGLLEGESDDSVLAELSDASLSWDDLPCQPESVVEVDEHTLSLVLQRELPLDSLIPPELQSTPADASVDATGMSSPVDGPVLAAPSAGCQSEAPCPICIDMPVRNLMGHIIAKHLPWFISPSTACWSCEFSEGSYCFLRHRHLDATDHDVSASFLTDEQLTRWCALTTGYLHAIRSELDLDSLGDLLEHVTKEQLAPLNCLFSAQQQGLLRLLDEYLGFAPQASYSVAPPSSISSLLHRKTLFELLRTLPPDAQARVTNTECLQDVHGAEVDVGDFEWGMLTTVDSHCHLDLVLTKHVGHDLASLEESFSAGRVVSTMIANFILPDKWDIHSRFVNDDRILFTFGVHPRQAGRPFNFGRLKDLLRLKKTVALGEIGFTYPADNEDQQVKLVEQLLPLAKEFDLPVVVHCQGPGTYEVMLAALRRHLPREHHLQLHSFAGSSNIVRAYLSEFPNTRFSLGGLLFHRADLDEMVQSLDLARILLETDAPYLAPPDTPFHRNHMWNVFTVGERVAELKNVPTRVVCEVARRNAQQFFGM